MNKSSIFWTIIFGCSYDLMSIIYTTITKISIHLVLYLLPFDLYLIPSGSIMLFHLLVGFVSALRSFIYIYALMRFNEGVYCLQQLFARPKANFIGLCFP